MKKGLIVLLIFILVIGAFVFGTKVNSNTSTDITATSLETPELSSDTTVTSENISTELTTFSDVHYEEPDVSSFVSEIPEGAMSYPSSAFDRIGRDCDTLLKIKDWYVADNDEEQNSIVIKNANRQGYYLEGSYAVEINTWSNWDINNSLIYNPDFVTLWSTDSDDFIPFYVYDDYTLVLGERDNEERIIVEEVINWNEYGSIIRAKIDSFGFENDETDVYFFVTSLQKILSFSHSETGEEKYTVGGDYRGLSERILYF